MALPKPLAKTLRGARKRLPEKLPHAGTIWAAGRATRSRKGAKSRREGFSAEFIAGSDFAYSLDAGLLVEHVSDSLMAHYAESTKLGLKPDGSGRQPRLKQRGRAFQSFERGFRKSPFRGFKTGLFVNTIRRSKITGTTTQARTKVLPDTRRNVFISTELERGIEYFSVVGTAAAVIKKATDQFIDGGMKNENRANVQSRETTSGKLRK